MGDGGVLETVLRFAETEVTAAVDMRVGDGAEGSEASHAGVCVVWGVHSPPSSDDMGVTDIDGVLAIAARRTLTSKSTVRTPQA